MIRAWFERIFRPDREISKRIERLDQRNRELRHDINNARAHTSALERLISQMREDDAWRSKND